MGIQRRRTPDDTASFTNAYGPNCMISHVSEAESCRLDTSIKHYLNLRGEPHTNRKVRSQP